MNPYDQAHQLANAPEARARNTSEYYPPARYRLRRRRQPCAAGRIQATAVSRADPNGVRRDVPEEEDMQRLNQLGVLLQFNPDASAYLLAEFRFQRMLSDIFKILAVPLPESIWIC